MPQSWFYELLLMREPLSVLQRREYMMFSDSYELQELKFAAWYAESISESDKEAVRIRKVGTLVVCLRTIPGNSRM